MALIEKVQQNVDATAWRGEIPMSYLYTAGRAGEEFFKALRDRGEFLGARCKDCGVIHFPAQMYCERCFRNLEGDYVKVPTRGVIHTYTVVYQTFDEKPKAPEVIALVRPEGTEGGIFHRLVGVEPNAVRIGMLVEAVLVPKKDRTGRLLDIRHFRPV